MNSTVSNAPADYVATTNHAGIFDTSASGKLLISGPDAPTFLTNLSTNDFRDLPLGGGREAYFLDHRAKTLFQAIGYHILHENRNAIWLDTAPGYGEKLLKHLDRYLISEAVELANVSDTSTQMHLAGPNARAILSQTLKFELPVLSEFEHLIRAFGAFTVQVRKRSLLDLDGYDLVCRSDDDSAGVLWQLLLAAGAFAGTAQTYETLRIEAATPIYGLDIDETRFVMEIARVARAVSYTKGCFIGQEPIVMARDRAGFVSRAFALLKTDSAEPLPSGTKLQRDGQEVGVVTSSTVSPKYSGPVVLAYLRRPHHELGTKFQTETPTGTVTLELVRIPSHEGASV